MQIFKRDGNNLQVALKSNDFFSQQDTPKSRFVFIVPHDDDIILGAGLLLQKALLDGIECSVLITTDGSMGYCSSDEMDTICEIRRAETINALQILGISDVEWLNFPDCNLNHHTGRRRAKNGDSDIVAGYTGLQNSYTAYLRCKQPTVIFLAADSDLHPDHKVVYQEVMISIFHAAGDIWPELGSPTDIPTLFEMAIYCDFLTPPNIKLQSNEKYLQKKIEAIQAYKSQKQIESLVVNMKEAGPVEYFNQITFNLYKPKRYQNLFCPA